MTSWTIGRTVLIHKDDWAYISHPSIVVLNTGEWLAAFDHARRRARRLHPPADPLFRTLLARSPDRGPDLGGPVLGPNFDWYGACLSEDGVTCVQGTLASLPRMTKSRCRYRLQGAIWHEKNV